jgi:hypothetical protein
VLDPLLLVFKSSNEGSDHISYLVHQYLGSVYNKLPYNKSEYQADFVFNQLLGELDSQEGLDSTGEWTCEHSVKETVGKYALH